MENKELIDKIYIKLISVCNDNCKECKHDIECTCMCGLEAPSYVGPIDYKYLEETFDLKFIARDLNIL